MRNAFAHFVAGSLVAILIGFGVLVQATPEVRVPNGNSILIIQGDGR
ncbi:hypothetical protein [Hoeflea sp.]